MKLTPDAPIKMQIYSRPQHLPIVRGAVEKMCELLGFDESSCSSVVLSVDEALANIIKHAYLGRPDGKIEIELASADADGDAIIVRLRDYGRAVDESQIKSRKLEDVRPGGLGVHIINKCMDEIKFEHPEGIGTLLTMRKCRSPASRTAGRRNCK